MESLFFKENNKSILFNIKDYQFSYIRKMDYYDVNWLTIQISYSDGNIDKTFEDSCLLTYELDALVEQINNIIVGKESAMISDFMEPYLKFSVTRVKDVYAVQIRFAYLEMEILKEIYISQEMDKNRLIRMRDELDELRKKFPIREVERK